MGNATLVEAERSGCRRVLGASKPRPSAKGGHPYKNGHVWRPWGYLPPNLLSVGLVIHPDDTLPNSESPEEAQDWCSCNCGDGTDQRVQSLMFMMMMMMIRGILEKIDEYRLNWFQHLQGMPQNRIPLKSYHYRPQGRWTAGWLKKRWREQL